MPDFVSSFSGNWYSVKLNLDSSDCAAFLTLKLLYLEISGVALGGGLRRIDFPESFMWFVLFMSKNAALIKSELAQYMQPTITEYPGSRSPISGTDKNLGTCAKTIKQLHI